jgi:mono/diheme cytochrome c family protein
MLVLALLSLAACKQEMGEQARYDAYEKAPDLPGGTVAQKPVPGTVARGEPEALRQLREKPPLTAELVRRGRERFDVFCSPCHGYAGYGDGTVVARGFPSPPSYHSPRLVTASDQHFVDVITDGFGVMYSYADRVPPRDRWAIAAYIRALQLSQAAPVDELPQADRRHVSDAGP